MTLNSEEALKNLNKDDLIGVAVNLQSKMKACSSNFLKELKPLNKNFTKLVADVAVTKNANLLLSSLLVGTERLLCKSLKDGNKTKV